MEVNKIIDYCENFYGYGNWESKIWFVGYEEYGGKTEKNIINRIESWHKYKTDLIDNREHHLNFIDKKDFVKLFDDGKAQRTWWKLIRLMLNYNKELANTENIRNIQKNSWGQVNSETLLIEFFPLPSKSIKDWEYSKYEHFKNIDFLKSREEYSEHIHKIRANYIKKKIKNHNPEVVVFYASSLMKYWDLIANTNFEKTNRVKINNNYFRYIKINGTLFVQTPQPAGVWSNDFWNKLGEEIRKIKKPVHNNV